MPWFVGSQTATFPSASVPGTPGQVLVNSSGNLAGTSTVTSNGTNFLLPGTTTVPTGTTGTVTLFGEATGTEVFPSFVFGDAPIPCQIVGSRALNINELIVSGNGNTQVSNSGATLGTLGTASSPNISFSDMPSSAIRRVRYTSAPVSSQRAGVRFANATALINGTSSTSGGGFRLSTSFGFSIVPPLGFGFAGIATTALSTSPNAAFNIVGIGFDAGDTNLSVYQNDGSGTPVKVSLGANFTISTNPLDYYVLTLTCAPPSATIEYRVVNLRNNAVASGTLSGDLPAVSSAHLPQVTIGTGTGSVAGAIDVSQFYAEIY